MANSRAPTLVVLEVQPERRGLDGPRELGKERSVAQRAACTAPLKRRARLEGQRERFAERLLEHLGLDHLVEGKINGVDPDFGSTLTVANRDSQSNSWVNWKIMSQPCEFQI